MAMKIALDPGHGHSNKILGAYDPGAVAFGVNEAEIVLAWALTGKWLLEQNRIQVWLSRDDDRDITPVATRAQRAMDAGCTHFISLHCNAGTLLATGTETYYRDTADQQLALIVQDAAVRAVARRDRGVKTESQSQHARLAVLDFRGPACLLETGFITNPWDRARVTNRNVRIAFWKNFIRQMGGTA
jgi:N-acetylmuramoyl-L-alanine amidase